MSTVQNARLFMNMWLMWLLPLAAACGNFEPRRTHSGSDRVPQRRTTLARAS
jgi:hypothetical protein